MYKYNYMTTTNKRINFWYNEYQTKFLIDNYSTLGSKKCSEILNIPVEKIRTKTYHLGLKLNKETQSRINKESKKDKKYEDYSVNPNQFLSIETPEIAYILGLVWADGYVTNNDNHYTIKINSLFDDLNTILHIFLKTGKWFHGTRNRKNRRKQMYIGTSNKIICNFLLENDYRSKSFESADKILSKIPEHLQHYWFRGLIDGDGCFYISKNKHQRQFSLASSYEQNWFFMEKLLKKFEIRYSIRRVKQFQHNRINKSSIIRTVNSKDIKKLGDYIYQGFLTDKIGFERKFKKYLEICSFCK